MTTISKLIADIKAGKLPLRDLSDRVLVEAGWEKVTICEADIVTGMTLTRTEYRGPNQIMWDKHTVPHPLASVDDALALLPEYCWKYLEGDGGTVSRWAFNVAISQANSFRGIADTAAKAICLAWLRMKNEPG